MPLAKLLSFRSWSVKELTSPWQGPSLFQFVSENGGSAELPDTPKQGENEISWVAGAMDGVTGRGFMDAGARDEKKQTQDLLTALAQLVKRSSEVNLTHAAPQLHTHAVIFNVTERENGQTRALQPQQLFASQTYATQVYRSELAVGIKPTPGTGEGPPAR